ncbi:MAG: tetratricopeptide repeat protein [bacterium]|nr:tetratricopeptide repeat protein [bacterium]
MRRYIKITLLFYTLIGVLEMFAQNTQRRADSIEMMRLKKSVSENYFSKGKQEYENAGKAIQFAIKLRDTTHLAELYKMIGVISYFSGEHDQALKFYFKSLDLYRIKRNLTGEASVYNEIGTLYKKNNRLKEAQEMFDNSYLIAVNNKDTLSMATALNNGGIVDEMSNELSAALLNYKQALNLYEMVKDTIGQSYCYENIGGVYLMQNNFNQSEEFLLKSLNLRLIKKLDQPTAFAYHYLGELYNKKGENAKAISMFNNALKIAQRIQYPDLVQRAYYSLSESFKKAGDYQQSLTYFSKATAVKDSLFNASRSEQLAEIQTKYEVENKNIENKLLKQKIELEIQKAKNNNIIMVVLIFGVLVLIFGGIFYYKRRQNHLEIQTQLKVQQAEQEQRLRISHDLHDHVGAQLSYVVSNLDIANVEFGQQQYDLRRLQSVTDMSKQAILTLRETVWALSNEAISLEAFSDKFKAYVQKMSEFSTHTNIQILDRIGRNDTLPPNVALHLFRICQEAFSNALKHAKAANISIEIVSTDSVFFECKIYDTGIGFNIEEAVNKGHYGLHNMRHRAKEIGALYELKSIPNQGTEVRITIKQKNTTYA